MCYCSIYSSSWMVSESLGFSMHMQRVVEKSCAALCVFVLCRTWPCCVVVCHSVSSPHSDNPATITQTILVIIITCTCIHINYLTLWITDIMKSCFHCQELIYKQLLNSQTSFNSGNTTMKIIFFISMKHNNNMWIVNHCRYEMYDVYIVKSWFTYNC
jgi:hypothetical protein